MGLDDTDVVGTPGTGHMGRHLAARLGERFPLFGVTRHQLLFDPRVPMTAKNSAVGLHFTVDERLDLEGLAQEVGTWVREAAALGSDPGLCLAQQVPQSIIAFGRRAKEALVTAAEAQALAEEAGMILRGLGGDRSGVIGALAAVGLAASGNDGRFTHCGRVRELQGCQPVQAILEAGVSEVRTTTGETLHEGVVETRGKLRPSLLNGRPVLWVDSQNGCWVAVRRD